MNPYQLHSRNDTKDTYLQYKHLFDEVVTQVMYHLFLTLALLSLINRAYGDTNYRLNTPIRPKAYSIAITPYFDTGDEKAFTFDGEVDITFKTLNTTDQIKLHSEDLSYDRSNITVLNGENNIQLAADALEFDTNYTFAFINLQTDLQIGVEYTLKIIYRGLIREDLNGFYRNYYIEGGVKKWLGATQMEPTHARKVFPCFDEPELKATFSLSIDRPESYKPSLANTKLQESIPLSNGYVRELFYPTPDMSTYLVAFMVSEFEGITRQNGTQEFGIYTRPEALNQSEYALRFGLQVVDALGDYFGISYYSTDEHLKLDHIALPDFRAGAMENWGLIKYRESLLLYVPEDSTPYYKYRVAQIVAHETTHMWFGNLVTCHWWSNTWLNEGFANYFQDYITASVDPEVASANVLVTGSVYAAYDADSSASSPAITNNDVNSPAEISGHFGTITYQKAGSVIRMMHHFVGDDAFKFGLQNYLETNKFTSGYPDKLYTSLEYGVQNYSALQAYPDTDITEVMSSWISQAGHPILQVDVDYENDKVVLTQKRFYTNSNNSSDEIYKIPITYTTGRDPDFETTKPKFVMHNKTHEFSIANISQDHPWVIFNIQETGLYRVNYDEHTWEMLTSALKGMDREKIHYLNRAKIVNDLFALLYADEINFSRLLTVLDYLPETAESDYSVWYAVIRGLNKLWHNYLGDEALGDVERWALRLLENGVTIIGYTVGEEDSFEKLRNRMQILEFACKLGHQGCIDNAVQLFKALKENGTEIDPSLRPVVYCNGLRHGNGDDYDFLWNRMTTTNVASEARVISELLGCTSDEEKLRSYLVSMLVEDSPIRFQDLTVPLASVLADYSHLPLVINELKNNYTLWSTIYPSMDTVLSTVASALHTEADFTEFESFLNSCSECTEEAKTSARTSLGQARASTAWATGHKQDILGNLRSHGSVLAPSILLVLGLVVAMETF